ncbi:hypothetical protein D3C87_1794340 [compost metagenome]
MRIVVDDNWQSNLIQRFIMGNDLMFKRRVIDWRQCHYSGCSRVLGMLYPFSCLLGGRRRGADKHRYPACCGIDNRLYNLGPLFPGQGRIFS